MLMKTLRPVSFVLIISFLMLNVTVPTAQARMIGTHEVIAEQQNTEHRAKVDHFLAREDVKQIMTQYGVDPIEAQKRVDSLTNDELAKVVNAMDQLPAGGSAVGVIVGAALIVFLVLLLTDILGMTHVFPFVTPQR